MLTCCSSCVGSGIGSNSGSSSSSSNNNNDKLTCQTCANDGCTNDSVFSTFLFVSEQWSFRGGTRGNAVPIVKIPLERMGTAFPLLSYGENAWERCCIVT